MTFSSTTTPPGFPTLKPALILKDVPTGTLTSHPSFSPPVAADIILGADRLSVDPDGILARPDVKTKEGQLSKAVSDMFAGDPDAKTLPFGASVSRHTFRTGAEKYKFLEDGEWVGNSRHVVKNDPRSITVEIRISQVVASTDME
ncbi:hypothetical protein EJ04DRAFT_529110 [Polyplosphaeria fusca]|uniref:Uncharacterized protein n=1 Tax=Polyplosphaeria fusca TaxID=682080 RepID=A0A9P4UV38_9PLEO|nr:hypothetical protein EJ04DRAFT_529110 [Polyplosphaeria fusca]